MPRRTMTRFAAAGLLVAAVAAPAAAQGPPERCCDDARPVANPWRVTAKPVAPAPRPAGYAIENITWCYTGPAGCCDTGCCAVAVAPMPRAAADLCQNVRVRVMETRTGQFLIGRGVNSDAGVCGTVCVNERATPPRVSVAVVGEECCRSGEEAQFRIRLTYAGPGPAPRTIIQARLSDGLVHPQGAVIEADVPRLTAGEEKVISLRTKASKAGVQSCQVAVIQDGCPVATEKTSVNVVEPVRESAPQTLMTGTYYREVAGVVVGFTFTPTGSPATAGMTDGTTTATVTLTADYAVAKDGTVHGVVTGADVDVTGDSPAALEMAGLGMMMQAAVDQPFAFRCRPTDGGVMVSHLRFAGLPTAGVEPNPVALVAGKYKTAAGKMPAPKATKAFAQIGGVHAGGKCDCGPTPEVAQPCPPPACPQPAPGPGLMNVFGGCQTWTGRMTLPSPQYLQHYPQYYPPEPAFPLPREPAGQELPAAVVPACPVPAAPCPIPAGGVTPAAATVPATRVVAPVPPAAFVGDWQRAAGECVVGVSVTPSAVTVRATLAGNGPGRFVLTGEYKELRDGYLVGVVTSADVEGGADGVNYKDLRALVEQPFACRFQARDGELIVLDVKVGGQPLDAESLGVLAGRYAKGEPKWPGKGKKKKDAVRGSLGAGVGTVAGAATGGPKAGAAVGGLIGAGTGAATDHPAAKPAGVYYAAGALGRAQLPLPADDDLRVLEAVSRVRGLIDPNGKPDRVTIVRRMGGDHINIRVDLNRATKDPRENILVQPGDLLLGGPAGDAPAKPGAANAYSADPNVRMQELLYQSEDLRRLGDEWRRFWFDDAPSHLTPERIHGGIL